jgi:hypothetical protein
MAAAAESIRHLSLDGFKTPPSFLRFSRVIRVIRS